MSVFRFWIPLQVRSKEFGMNELYSQSKHWGTRKWQAQQVHMLVRQQIRKVNRNAKPFDKPVVVTIWYNTRLDIDNHGYLAKLIIDGMKGILIQDDDRKNVKGIRQYFHSSDKGKIFVEVEEV